MNRVLLKLILGLAVALGLTLSAAPVASAAPSTTAVERAVSCTVQKTAAEGAQANHAAADAQVAKLRKKITTLKKQLKKAHRAHQPAKVAKLKKKLKNKRAKIRQARIFRAKASTVATATSAAYASCQQGQVAPIVIPDNQNLLDHVGELLASIGLGDLVRALGLDAVLDLLDQLGLLDLLGLGALRG